MRTALVILSFFVMVSLLTPHKAMAQNNQEPVNSKEEIEYFGNVRGFIWGLPKEIIRAEEDSNFADESEDGSILYYVDTINGIPTSVNYEFEDNKLRRVRIFSESDYAFPQKRIDDYIKMKEDIDARYGQALEENFTWHNDREKKFPEMWGWAVKAGDLEITTTWQDAETLVTLFMGGKPTRSFKNTYGVNNQPMIVVTFEDKKAKLRKQQEQRKRAISIIP